MSKRKKNELGDGFKVQAYIHCYELVRNEEEGTGSHWEGKEVECEVLTVHFEKESMRVRYVESLGLSTKTVDVDATPFFDKYKISEGKRE